MCKNKNKKYYIMNYKINSTQNKINNSVYKFFPKTKDELKKIINNQIKKFGDGVDLNNIDVSQITNLTLLFVNSSFNGDISK